MPAASPPRWIEVRPGDGPVVLFAPHGGRRLAARQPGQHKVNDLHTANLTDLLAARLGATAIVNRTRDRNELDLNRIKQVRAHAPWLPALLADALEAAVARTGHALLLVVHGWNIGQAACDVGIGMVDGAGGPQAARTGATTVSERFVAETLPRLRAAAAPAGIALTVGARYPAAHPNNLMQLFTAAYADDSDPAVQRLGILAAAGQLDAVQLELGIPLRWPGSARERLLDFLTSTLTGATNPRAPDAPTVPPELGCRGRVIARRALQFLHDDLFGLTAVEVGRAGSVGGRLLLSSRSGTLELFTGELGDRSGARWHVPPLRYDDAPGCWRLHYRGELLSFGNLEPFLDLENGLADGRLVPAEVALDFRSATDAGNSADGVTFGDLSGRIVVGPRSVDVQTTALRSDGAGLPTQGRPSLRLVVPGTTDGPLALASTAGEHRDGALSFTLAGGIHHPTGHDEVAGHAMVQLTGDRGVLAAQIAGRELRGRLERLIPVRRPGGPGTVLHTTYGLCHLDRPRTTGWIELLTEHALPAKTPAG